MTAVLFRFQILFSAGIHLQWAIAFQRGILGDVLADSMSSFHAVMIFSIVIFRKYLSRIGESEQDQTFAKLAKDFAHFANFTVPLCDVL